LFKAISAIQVSTKIVHSHFRCEGFSRVLLTAIPPWRNAA
jgi:hypothetical protein